MDAASLDIASLGAGASTDMQGEQDGASKDCTNSTEG